MIYKLASIMTLCFFIVSQVSAQLNLVGNKVKTFIDQEPRPARLIALVDAAFIDTQTTFTATTRAWSGSGLLSGQFDGYIDHYSLNNKKGPYVYSKDYVTLELHLASRSSLAAQINRFEQIEDQRVGVEKRFANTDRLRGERSVKWARRDSFYENIQQLQERRVDYILADRIMIEEMNKLLSSINKPPLFMSEAPILSVGISIALSDRVEAVQARINEFEQGIEMLKTSGQYDKLYLPQAGAASQLDAALFSEVLRKW